MRGPGYKAVRVASSAIGPVRVPRVAGLCRGSAGSSLGSGSVFGGQPGQRETVQLCFWYTVHMASMEGLERIGRPEMAGLCREGFKELAQAVKGTFWGVCVRNV